jgi:hypothetical protein
MRLETQSFYFMISGVCPGEALNILHVPYYFDLSLGYMRLSFVCVSQDLAVLLK